MTLKGCYITTQVSTLFKKIWDIQRRQLDWHPWAMLVLAPRFEYREVWRQLDWHYWAMLVLVPRFQYREVWSWPPVEKILLPGTLGCLIDTSSLGMVCANPARKSWSLEVNWSLGRVARPAEGLESANCILMVTRFQVRRFSGRKPEGETVSKHSRKQRWYSLVYIYQLILSTSPSLCLILMLGFFFPLANWPGADMLLTLTNSATVRGLHCRDQRP